MNLQQLEYALTLEKAGSFTKAAQQLSMTQPALSLQIKNLEKEMGIALFDRSKGKIEPTELGLKFLIKAGEIVMAGKQLKEYAYSLGKGHKGSIKIGIIPTLSPFLVPLFADSLLERYPDLNVEISELLTEQILQQIRFGELDGGIISTPVERQGITTSILFYESFYFYRDSTVNAENNTISVSNLDLSDLWLLEEGNCFRDQVNDICSLRDTRIVRLKYRCS
ncbi:MAG: LysR family transcriptional regulator, partial [Ekhidna sp.]|nr:LysR family transcriptional regulator [Ekhidna sp.]